ncbi:MAG: Uma2 family endonuclease [Chitinophagaceae bacterium]
MENEVKEPAPGYNFVSVDEYFERELNADERLEYYDGLVLAMSGGSISHNAIDRNLISALHNYLKGKECQVFPPDLRITNLSPENYLYPDASIVCGNPELQENRPDTLTNPSVIFEILSPSTRSADKRRKFFFYMQIPSLKEYIMIDSQKRHITTGRKQPDGSWKFDELHTDARALKIQTINFSLPVSDLYEGTGL